MNRAVWSAGAAGMAGFVLGVGVMSWWAPGASDATDPAVDGPAAERSAKATGSRTPAVEITRLQEDLATERDARKSAEARASAVALDERLTFFETFPREVHLDAFRGDLTVTPEIAAALGIEQSEADALVRALRKARESVDAIEARNLRIVEQTDERTVLEIPGYPEGATVKATLEADVKEILGNRRGGIFIQKCRSPFASQFSNFGDDTLTRVEILWKENGGKGSIKQTQTGPSGTMTSSGPFVSLPARFRNLLEVTEQTP